MKNENEIPLSDAELTSLFIQNLSTHPQYSPVPDLPIPLQNGVLVMKLDKPGIVKSILELEGGGTTDFFEATGNNTQDTCEGIIMAVGPNCSKYMHIGLKCQYSTQARTTFRHKGKNYLAMDEYSVLFIVPDEDTLVDNGVKDVRQLRREKKIPQQDQTLKNIYNHEQNEKDKKSDKTKGKIKPVSNKLK